MKTLLALTLLSLTVAACNNNNTTPQPDLAMTAPKPDLAGPQPDLAGPQPDLAMTVSNTAAVDVMDNFFTPATVTITAGGTVTWTWRGGNPHSVTNKTGSTETYDSGITPSGSFSHTYPTAGTFNYYCKVHGVSMSGTVTVQ
jgi:plastocyanin